MSDIHCIRDLINLWPSRKALADDINRVAPELQVTAGQVYKWGDVDSIRAKFHYALIQCGQARGFPVTADLLVRLHAPAFAAPPAPVADEKGAA